MQWSDFGVDAAYCINLDRKPNRYEAFQQQTTDLGLPIERVSAVDGLDLIVPDTVEEHLTTIGCRMSHINVMKKALDQGYNRILVFEDDIMLQGQEQRFLDFLKALPEDWEWMNSSLPCDEYPDYITKFPSYRECRASMNMHGYGVAKPLMQLMVDRHFMEPFISSRNIHVDAMMIDTAIRNDIPCYIPNEPFKQDGELGSNNVWGWVDRMPVYRKIDQSLDFRLLVICQKEHDASQFDCLEEWPSSLGKYSHVLFCGEKDVPVHRLFHRFREAVRRHDAGLFVPYDPPCKSWYYTSFYTGEHQWVVQDPNSIKADVFGFPVSFMEDKFSASSMAVKASEQGRLIVADTKVPVSPLARQA